jgi:GT2 family glycosyltransferase
MEAIRRVGYFDVLFSPTQYGDADYSFRMWLAGYSCVYDGRIEIVHHFKAYQDKDDPMRQVYSMSHAYAIDLKYKGLMRFGLQLEEAIDRMGREITLPQGASPVRT